MDCQVLNEHTASLGAVEISRRHYIEHRTVPKGDPTTRFLGSQNALYTQCLNVFRIFFMRVL